MNTITDNIPKIVFRLLSFSDLPHLPWHRRIKKHNLKYVTYFKPHSQRLISFASSWYWIANDYLLLIIWLTNNELGGKWKKTAAT